MKQWINLRNLDLADRFSMSRATISNNVTQDSLLHCMKSFTRVSWFDLLKSLNLEDHPSVNGCTDNPRCICHQTYTDRVPRSVTKKAGIPWRFWLLLHQMVISVHVTSLSRICVNLVPGDLILADKSFNIHDQMPSCVHLTYLHFW